MVIFWFVYSCFAPGLLKSVELFSKKVLSRNQMPRSWKGIPPSSSSEWKAESFWKISWFERKQMLRVWLNVVGYGLQTCAHLLSTPGTAALLLPVPVWPQAWRQFLLFIHACISLVLAIAGLSWETVLFAPLLSVIHSVCLWPLVGEAALSNLHVSCPHQKRFPYYCVAGISSLIWVIWVI